MASFWKWLYARSRYLEMSVNNIKDYATHASRRGEELGVCFFLMPASVWYFLSC